MIDVRIEGTIGRGEFRAPVELELEAGSTVIVRGPNGAGKTTLVRTIAGLEALADGGLFFDGVAADEPGRGVFVPAHRRPIALAFQEPRLFTHLSVLANVTFGLRADGVSRHQAETAALEALASTGADHLADARPADLSGGQAQRVGLARTLARRQPVLLVDEPLSAVDASIRDELRDLIAAQPATTLWVSHADLENLPADAGIVTLG